MFTFSHITNNVFDIFGDGQNYRASGTDSLIRVKRVESRKTVSGCQSRPSRNSRRPGGIISAVSMLWILRKLFCTARILHWKRSLAGSNSPRNAKSAPPCG